MSDDRESAGGDRGVFPLEHVTVLPASVVVDTSFMAAALDESAPEHEAAAVFLARLTQARTVIFFNDLVDLEMHDVAFGLAARESSAGGTGAHRTVGVLARSMLARWGAVLAHAEAVHVDVALTIDDLPYYMGQFGLSAQQAAHVGTSFLSEAQRILTVDVDFGRVDETTLRIYTPERLVRATRARRPRPAA